MGVSTANPKHHLRLHQFSGSRFLETARVSCSFQPEVQISGDGVHSEAIPANRFANIGCCHSRILEHFNSGLSMWNQRGSAIRGFPQVVLKLWIAQCQLRAETAAVTMAKCLHCRFTCPPSPDPLQLHSREYELLHRLVPQTFVPKSSDPNVGADNFVSPGVDTGTSPTYYWNSPCLVVNVPIQPVAISR